MSYLTQFDEQIPLRYILRGRIPPKKSRYWAIKKFITSNKTSILSPIYTACGDPKGLKKDLLAPEADIIIKNRFFLHQFLRFFYRDLGSWP